MIMDVRKRKGSPVCIILGLAPLLTFVDVGDETVKGARVHEYFSLRPTVDRIAPFLGGNSSWSHLYGRCVLPS
jgi:hypothetical protein